MLRFHIFLLKCDFLCEGLEIKFDLDVADGVVEGGRVVCLAVSRAARRLVWRRWNRIRVSLRIAQHASCSVVVNSCIVVACLPNVTRCETCAIGCVICNALLAVPVGVFGAASLPLVVPELNHSCILVELSTLSAIDRYEVFLGGWHREVAIVNVDLHNVSVLHLVLRLAGSDEDFKSIELLDVDLHVFVVVAFNAVDLIWHFKCVMACLVLVEELPDPDIPALAQVESYEPCALFALEIFNGTCELPHALVGY